MSQVFMFVCLYVCVVFVIVCDEGVFVLWLDVLVFFVYVVVDLCVVVLFVNLELGCDDVVVLLVLVFYGEIYLCFLVILVELYCLLLLLEIFGMFDVLCVEVEYVVKVIVILVVELLVGELDVIKVVLCKCFNCEVDVIIVVDVLLIGGVVIDVGDVVIDGLLKGKLVCLQIVFVN